ncbi:hypothetical protein [Tuberibacillus sp. Marseille-P3662]|uniref:hypothetical protein n=1 Tax=Tuberibacillus sp. Marseille-P3662 TaxID=1965358 RepID=UPI000A1CC701|nr:hypothetical protein [Tuberibacillus sp. Marseille-P3662]
MIVLSSLEALKNAENALNQLKAKQPDVFSQLLHMISLTRQLQLKYEYMGRLFMGEEPGEASPRFVKESVVRLYESEVMNVKEQDEAEVIKQIFSNYKHIGYENLSLLALGNTPDSLKGVS